MPLPPSPTESSSITKEEFIKEIEITVQKRSQYALGFPLNLIKNGEWYCYCEEIVKEENVIKSKRRWKSGHCQICKILHIFDDFETFVDKNCFNMEVLCIYYDQIFYKLVKLFDQCPKATESFLWGSTYTVVATGTVANTGVFLYQKVFGMKRVYVPLK